MNNTILNSIKKHDISNIIPQILPHQLATIDFLFKTCYDDKKSVLLFHKMGSGKTIVSLLFSLLICSEKQIVIILPNQTILHMWEDQLQKTKVLLPNYPFKEENIEFKTRQKFNEDLGYKNAVENMKLYDNKIIIIDEAHNFFGNKTGDILITLKKNINIVYILLTGSPITNTVSTLKDIIETLTGVCFDVNKYIDSTGNKVYQRKLNADGIKYLKSQLYGLISYYNKDIQSVPQAMFVGEPMLLYPVIICTMSKLQEDNYNEIIRETNNPMFIKLLMNVSMCALGSKENYENFAQLTLNSNVDKELLPGLTISNGLLKGRELVDLNISSKFKTFINSLITERNIGKRFIYFANSFIGSVVIRSILMANGVSEYDKGIVDNFMCVSCIKDRTCDVCTPMKFAIITSKEVNKGSELLITKILNIYNEDINDNGNNLLLLFGSKIISEAYTLKNVKDIWFLTVPETKTELTQFIARAVRTFSHKDITVKVKVRICLATTKDFRSTTLETIKLIDTSNMLLPDKTIKIDKYEKFLQDDSYLIPYDVKKQLYLELKSERSRVVDVAFKSLNKIIHDLPHKKLAKAITLEIIRRIAYNNQSFTIDDCLSNVLYGFDKKSDTISFYTNIIKSLLSESLVVYNKLKKDCIITYNKANKIIELHKITLQFNHYLLCVDM